MPRRPPGPTASHRSGATRPPSRVAYCCCCWPVAVRRQHAACSRTPSVRVQARVHTSEGRIWPPGAHHAIVRFKPRSVLLYGELCTVCNSPIPLISSATCHKPRHVDGVVSVRLGSRGLPPRARQKLHATGERMALSMVNGYKQRILSLQLCKVLDAACAQPARSSVAHGALAAQTAGPRGDQSLARLAARCRCHGAWRSPSWVTHIYVR